MTYNHTLSVSIDFTEAEISKEKFIQFLDVLFQIDRHAYSQEMEDNFLDLFNYWNNKGYKRFIDKLDGNLEKLKNFQS